MILTPCLLTILYTVVTIFSRENTSQAFCFSRALLGVCVGKRQSVKMALAVTLQDAEEEDFKTKKHGNLKIDARGPHNR